MYTTLNTYGTTTNVVEHRAVSLKRLTFSFLCVLPVSSRSSSMYLWTSSRSAGHAFVFDAVDGFHLTQKHEDVVPSFGLHQRANTLINFYCNVYDVATADDQRCCVARRPWHDWTWARHSVTRQCVHSTVVGAINVKKQRFIPTWRLGVVVSVVGRINEVNQHRARLVRDGWP